ncbi:hypothetical protein ACQPWW_10635 [Micromonospora sp. CA-240977]
MTSPVCFFALVTWAQIAPYRSPFDAFLGTAISTSTGRRSPGSRFGGR